MDGGTLPRLSLPAVRLALSITGHRAAHPVMAGAQDRIATVLGAVLDEIDRACGGAPHVASGGALAPTRLHTMLADGVDSMASAAGLARGYELVAPLPFGRRLNRAINSLTNDPAEARALLAGEEGTSLQARAHAATIRELSDQARIFGLADDDERITELFLAKLDNPHDLAAAQLFNAECSVRAALAGRILIEQSDLLIAVWDGNTAAHVGGTGHTVEVALDLGVPVLWIDPAMPDDWRIVQSSEELAGSRPASRGQERSALLRALVHDALDPRVGSGKGVHHALEQEVWHDRSQRRWHAYRRVERLFGSDGWGERFASLRQTYESPEAVADGSGAAVIAQAAALPGGDGGMATALVEAILRRFAWTDGVSDRLSDAYRGGMTISFLLSTLAIIGGVLYLPFGEAVEKWPFALFELALLGAILAIIAYGRRRRLHSRWFETRRLAEYLRHGSLLALIGCARPAGRWPRGTEASWPEFVARQSLREVGLPHVAVSQDYLRAFLAGPLTDHAGGQASYHAAKAERLAKVHDRLDHLSLRCFQLAVFSVALYLALRGAAALELISENLVASSAKTFTVLGVTFPTLGAGIAGIRYFGDFQRFSEISEVTSEKLAAVGRRIEMLLEAPAGNLRYGQVADLVRATDNAVIAELESWQSVFRSKHVSVPV